MTQPEREESAYNENELESVQETENKEGQPLDTYVTTGVYVEENKEYGDLLIVLGEEFLPSHLRQFYITANDEKIFTRILSHKTWSSWFIVQHEKLSEQHLDFNTYKEAALIKLENISGYSNAPENFEDEHGDKNNMLICLSLEEEHIVQFLVSETKRSFWIRHYASQEWSSWQIFI
ncbi:MAG: pyocin knob domain-containing protein [Victivallaceae bacterium]